MLRKTKMVLVQFILPVKKKNKFINDKMPQYFEAFFCNKFTFKTLYL